MSNNNSGDEAPSTSKGAFDKRKVQKKNVSRKFKELRDGLHAKRKVLHQTRQEHQSSSHNMGCSDVTMNVALLPEQSGGMLNSAKTPTQIEAELRALTDILRQLSCEDAQLCERISKMIHTMPALNLFNVSTLTHPDNVACVQKDANHLIANSGTDHGNPPQSPEKRKRGKRGTKPQSAQKKKCQASELQDLVKYVNQIVNDFSKLDEASTSAKSRENLPEFAGGLADLEAYAEELLKFGIGRIVEGELRINHKNNRQSFITISNDRETLQRDGMILLPVARRYAFEGDLVRAFVLNESTANKQESSFKEVDDVCVDESFFDSSESLNSTSDSNGMTEAPGPVIATNCPKAFVIDIVKHVDNRQVVGTVSFKNTTQLLGEDGPMYYKFRPYDMRMPMMYVSQSSYDIRPHAKFQPCDLLYVAQVCEIDINGHCIAKLLELIGPAGSAFAELKAILKHNGFKDLKPYDERFNVMFADPGLPVDGSEHREDLRKQCIFTIDPPTARDLDDALSVEKLDEDEFEVGVHIADVAYFLPEDSELDNLVKQRATSIYLVNDVIHMLPPALCYKCSLVPGEDKFAFSVFWHMNAEGKVLGEPRFTRSIVNSCVKLAYPHAQRFIENSQAHLEANDFPKVHNEFTLSAIFERLEILKNMARHMRCRRFDNGALSINNPRLRFELDKNTGEPLAYEIECQQEANHLIEEFMLLANMTVAERIYTHFPEIAILRNHAPPLLKSINSLQEKLASLGLNLDTKNSKAIYSSMLRLCKEAKDYDAMNACLSTLLTKPMARAKYFCSDGKSVADLCHYALSIPIYTHFTSPIRRYPDIMVHRLLAATLNYCPPPQRSPDELCELAQICNQQKFNAKNAGDESTLLFFKRYVKAKQGLVMRAAVFEIFQHLLNVVTIETGHVLPLVYKVQRVLVGTGNVPKCIYISEEGSKLPPTKLEMFSVVEIKVVVRNEKLFAFFVSPDFRQRQINRIEMDRFVTASRPRKSKKASSALMRQEKRLEKLKLERNNQTAEDDAAVGQKQEQKQEQPKEQQCDVTVTQLHLAKKMQQEKRINSLEKKRQIMPQPPPLLEGAQSKMVITKNKHKNDDDCDMPSV